jgi:hypothetical protein
VTLGVQRVVLIAYVIAALQLPGFRFVVADAVPELGGMSCPKKRRFSIVSEIP